MSDKEILLKDIGHPRAVRIPIPEDGGIVVLTGRNGAGKSTTLEAVQDVITDRKEKRSTVREGADSGLLMAPGITMTVGRRTAVKGELEFESLDGGRLSIADVVSPPYKGLEEADGRRIKALVQLAGVGADPKLFRGIHPEFDDLFDHDQFNTNDILGLAAQIKATIEEHARSAESTEAHAKSKAEACEEAAKGVDIDVETDTGKLQLAFEDSVREAQRLKSAADQAAKRRAEIMAAKQEMTRVTLRRPGDETITLKDAKYDEAQAANAVSDQILVVNDAEAKLRFARETLADLQHRRELKKQQLAAAEHFAETVADLEKIISGDSIEAPTPEEIADADEVVTAAREAIEAGGAARKAQGMLELAKQLHATEAAQSKRALELRNAAAAVDDVLTAQIAKLGTPLRVKAGRLVVKTPRSKDTFFAELSEGERWKIATEIAIKAVGRHGLLAVPQEAFQGIQPAVRIELDKMAKEAGVVILTAMCTDDEEIQVIWLDKGSYTVKVGQTKGLANGSVTADGDRSDQPVRTGKGRAKKG